MTFTRPKSSSILMERAERRAMLEQYFLYYSQIAQDNPVGLNQKLSRIAFAGMLDSIGELLLRESAVVAKKEGRAREFLDENPLPPMLSDKLPVEFRTYCLALNALKQWVAAEQAATDRYLLGGTARAECRAVATNCVLSGDQLTDDNTHLHHPVRDGRPPIPLSKKAHAEIEGQTSGMKAAGKSAEDGSATTPTEGIVTYSASRLVFKAKAIEPLRHNERFRVETPEGIYEMTKAEFYESFPNVAKSDSYKANGNYRYSKTPSKALAYRVEAHSNLAQN
jgi:hypothetical protein